MMKLFIGLRRCLFAIIILIPLITVLGFAPVTLAATAPYANLHMQRAQTTNSVTVLILDMSGSMGQNDPDGLRCSAADAYIDLTGPGNYVGVIGLDTDTAQIWSEPTDMSTLASRQNLKDTIRQQSHNCKPDSYTPTYDALSKALQMLKDNALNKELPGSVLLLTDGGPFTPAYITANQVNDIINVHNGLAPQFKQHNWPIDVVGLGSVGPDDIMQGDNISSQPFKTQHDFMRYLASTTSGKFYDDTNGVIVGEPSPFNIAPFFVDIFARHNHRILQKDDNGDGVLSLNGGTIARDFTVPDHTSHLDILVIKDNAGTTAKLLNPQRQDVTQQAGVFVAKSDPHYEIFSIDQPGNGTWELDTSGTGNVLLESLRQTDIHLTKLAVTQAGLTASSSQALALGQELTITAALTDAQGQPIIDPSFTLQGTISSNGASGSYNQEFKLSDQGKPGVYTVKLNVPESNAAGSYAITINASQVSGANVLASDQLSVRLDHFPRPQFFSVDGQLQQNADTTVVQWDPLLQLLYNHSNSFVDWLSMAPLQNHPAGQAYLSGEVISQGQPYPGASVTAQASGSGSTSPAILVDDGNARFHLFFPASTANAYTVTFQSSGAFEDTYGDFGATRSTVNVATRPATIFEEGLAWLVTLGYLVLLVCIGNFFRFIILPRPFGGAIQSRGGDVVGMKPFAHPRQRFPFQAFFNRNIIRSRQVGLPAGLLIRFHHGGGIEVRADGIAGGNWRKGDGGPLSTNFQEAREIRFRPRGQEDEEDVEPATYLIKAELKATDNPAYEDSYNDLYAGEIDERPSRQSRQSRQSRAKRGSKQRATSSRRDDDYEDW